MNNKQEYLDNILYVAIVLNNNSVKTVRDIANLTIPNIWNNEQDDIQLVCHHSTLSFNSISKPISDTVLKYTLDNENETILMKAVAIGYNDKALALKVEYSAPCDNTTKHITLAVNKSNNGKPVHSNQITNWANIKPIILAGKVKTFHPNHK